MKIGVKLALGFAFIVIAMLATVLFCLDTNKKIQEKFEVLADNIIPGAIAMTAMEGKCQQIAHDLMRYIVIAGDEEKKEAAVKAGLESLEKSAAEYLESKKYINPKEQDVAKQSIEEIEKFVSICTEILNLKKQGLNTSELLEKKRDVLHPAMDRLLSQLRKLTATHMREMAEAKLAVYQAHTSGEQVALLVSFAVIFISAMIALRTTRSIVRPLHALHKGTEIIGKGRLDYRVATKAKDEIGQLSRAFDEMTQNLKNTTTSIDKLDVVNEKLQSNQEQLRVLNRQLRSEVAERKKTQEALEVSNRNLTDFVYVASHDLREPLRKISSFGQLLQQSLQGKFSEDDQENLDFMIDGSDRMTMMIDGLLTYSRVNTKDILFETVDLNKVIEQLKELELSMALEETGGVIDVPRPLPKVYADPVQIQQLLQNLIANGLKYRNKEVKPRITIKAEEVNGDKAKIEVQDNGIGIAPEYRDEIFKMFKRLHSRKEKDYDGCGIGLSVCKRIVERHGGKIGVESDPGAGSTFWFTISLTKDAVPAVEAVTVS
ncbi:MAG: HAMP domain-containing protein [Sedimentisphaerales bacterium]|nr:HAMP domain-containing protein [Sedimentisphaerales bacterium]